MAADGKLYFTGEDGKIRVVKAGPEFKLLAVNEMGETCMATPAISNGKLLVRTEGHLYGIGRRENDRPNYRGSSRTRAISQQADRCSRSKPRSGAGVRARARSQSASPPWPR